MTAIFLQAKACKMSMEFKVAKTNYDFKCPKSIFLGRYCTIAAFNE
jgi:hypothetical protein